MSPVQPVEPSFPCELQLVTGEVVATGLYACAMYLRDFPERPTRFLVSDEEGRKHVWSSELLLRGVAEAVLGTSTAILPPRWEGHPRSLEAWKSEFWIGFSKAGRYLTTVGHLRQVGWWDKSADRWRDSEPFGATERRKKPDETQICIVLHRVGGIATGYSVVVYEEK